MTTRWSRWALLPALALLLVITGCSGASSPVNPTPAPTQAPGLGRLVTMPAAGPQNSWQAIVGTNAGDKEAIRQLGKLKGLADEAKARTVTTVTSKTVLPPGGDKHNYLSYPEYWNPELGRTIDGVQYPDVESVADRKLLRQMITDVSNLGLAYYLTYRPGSGQSADPNGYARKARDILVAWFVNPATRMNPNLQYAQIKRYVPRGYDPNSLGIIDGKNLPQVLDAITFIKGANVLTAAEERDLTRWFSEYYRWLTASPQGKREGSLALPPEGYGNNRTTWYYAQAAALATWLGQTADVARYTTVGTQLVGRLIRPDGSQPVELARTKSWDYSVSGLTAFLRLGYALGQQPDGSYGLFRHSGPGGASIEAAFKRLLPYAYPVNPQHWVGNQITEFNPKLLNPAYAMASYAFGRPQGEQLHPSEYDVLAYYH